MTKEMGMSNNNYPL